MTEQPAETTVVYRPTGLTPEQAWRALNPRQQRFVAIYEAEPNAALTAREAGYSPNGTKVQGCRLPARQDIQAASHYGAGVDMGRAMARGERCPASSRAWRRTPAPLA